MGGTEFEPVTSTLQGYNSLILQDNNTNQEATKSKNLPGLIRFCCLFFFALFR
jgi:hypothetical protein